MEEEFEVDPKELFEKRFERDGLYVSEGNKVHKCLSIKEGHISNNMSYDIAKLPWDSCSFCTASGDLHIHKS